MTKPRSEFPSGYSSVTGPRIGAMYDYDQEERLAAAGDLVRLKEHMRGRPSMGPYHDTFEIARLVTEATLNAYGWERP